MNFLQQVFSGVALGCIYALIALGFVLIYKATETVNFAQGELMMLGAFAGLVLIKLVGLPFWVGVFVALVGITLFGILIERVVIRPVLGQPQFTVVMLTIGLGYVARGLITMIPVVGSETSALDSPYKGEVLSLGGLILSYEQIMVIGVTVVLCTGFFLLFKHTKVGIAMQAASQNQLAAHYMGIPVKRLNGLVWGLSAGAAGLAGLLLAPFTFVHVNMGYIGLKAFPAAVIGGFGSLPGAVVGGLAIGIVESLAGYYLPEGFKDVAAYVLVLVMLMVRPNGLFGTSMRKKV